MLAVVLPAGYLLGDFTAGQFVASQRTVSLQNSPEAQAVPEVQALPKTALTPGQVEFWNYLETFNRLPENPTEEMVAVYNSNGIAPKFHYLKSSKTSVIGDIKGLTAHRERFIKRYSWVQPLLDQYSIDIPISPERFSGAINEIAEKYWIYMSAATKAVRNPDKEGHFEKNLVRDFLEGLLVVDYIFACGTSKDKRESMNIVECVFGGNSVLGPLREKIERSILSPASHDIGWAILADYPDLCWGAIPNTVSYGFLEFSPANKINFYKWKLNTKGIPYMDQAYERNGYRGFIHNEQVKMELLSYSIYSAHSHEVGRPPDAPWLIVIKILFKRLYPKDHVIRYKQYLTLLDAAYPKIKS